MEQCLCHGSASQGEATQGFSPPGRQTCPPRPPLSPVQLLPSLCPTMPPSNPQDRLSFAPFMKRPGVGMRSSSHLRHLAAPSPYEVLRAPTRNCPEQHHQVSEDTWLAGSGLTGRPWPRVGWWYADGWVVGRPWPVVSDHLPESVSCSRGSWSGCLCPWCMQWGGVALEATPHLRPCSISC